ncbi:MAG: hypothetical protein HLX52_07505 [Idiomarinaceae bacterium]|uniref:DUF6279 family lipoprotein n=1 Tax=Idiomarina sp. 28-8 TaxID=1260624 RepID=UPI0002DB3045|nr:DUF6279 family lipoprotein [Idiomarina sp. 28-8]NWO02785.1 hypothetical protein [Idiomarinaceae bacterium]
MYRLLAVITFLILVAGCTANLGYKFADTLVEWEIKDYVDLTGEQEELLSEKVDELHIWHAQTQLPLYRNKLKNLRDKVDKQTLSKSDIGDFEDKLWTFWDNVLVRAEAEADLLAMLSLKQRQQLIRRLEEAQEERYQRFQDDQEENPILRRLDRISEVEEDLEDIIGSLTKEQDKLLRSWVADSPQLREQWLSYRSNWLSEFEKALLKQPVDENRLSALILDPQQLRSEELQEKADENSQLRKEFLWDMYRSLTDEQRKKVIEKADEYIDLLDSLIDDFND